MAADKPCPLLQNSLLATQNPNKMVTTLWPLGWRWKVGCLLGGGGLSGGGCCIKIVGKSMGCVYRVSTSYLAYVFFNKERKNFRSIFRIILKGTLAENGLFICLLHLLTFLHFPPNSTKSTKKHLSIFTKGQKISKEILPKKTTKSHYPE